MERLLARVEKPARYVGGELNMVTKDPESVRLRFALAFPDIYEVGMSHLGSRLLYDILNQREDTYCERAYMPWGDMEAELIKERMPLFTLETHTPLSAFELIGFSLTQEMCYTSVLAMLELSGVAALSSEREGPFVIAGGPCACNIEPAADFFDLVVLGDGEEVIHEIADAFILWKSAGQPREAFLRAASKIEGVYVPSFYRPRYEGGAFCGVEIAEEGAPESVRKRAVKSLEDAPYPDKMLVPGLSIVHDRAMLEIFRGCTRGCRFCQAGHITRPVRTRRPETLVKQGVDSILNTGYEEISLTSLSTSDYKPLESLCDALLAFSEPRRVSLSLPSLRADSFSRSLLEKVQKVRKSGLTFAPEAGSARLRDVVNKNLTEEDLLSACGLAFSGGYRSVKLYFMCGLPTETDEDIVSIAELAHKVFYHWRRTTDDRAKGITITVSTACFVPKPHTPFQWESQCTPEAFAAKQTLLKQALKKQISFRWHEATTSVLEGALSRGDRRLGRVIETAYRKGCRMDGWHECFAPALWEEAFAECGLTTAFYAHRERSPDETLPWAYISCGVSNEHLLRERARAYQEKPSPDCRAHCMACGADVLSPACHSDAQDFPFSGGERCD